MKILLITSEELHPGNLFSSCFELAQAKALKNIDEEVAIISVRFSMPFSDRILHIFKSAAAIFIRKYRSTYRLESSLKAFFNEIVDALFHPVKEYTIEGVKVFEGRGFTFSRFSSFEKKLKRWIQVGNKAIKKYEQKNGLPDLIHAHSRFLYAGMLAYNVKEEKNIKYVLTEHSTYYNQNPKPNHLLPYIKKMYQSVDSIIMVSHSLGNTVEKNFVPDIKGNWKVIPNILDEKFNHKEFAFPPQKGFNIITIGSLNKRKNQLLLLKALSELKDKLDFHLKIAGSGPYQSILEQFVKEKGLINRVTFLGQLSVEEVVQSLDEAHLFILTSQYETFGVVVIEALSRGRPVITTRCCGPEDLIDNSNGILIEKDNPKELIRAIIKVHENYTQYDLKKIREDAIIKYGPSTIAREIRKVYRDVTP